MLKDVVKVAGQPLALLAVADAEVQRAAHAIGLQVAQLGVFQIGGNGDTHMAGIGRRPALYPGFLWRRIVAEFLGNVLKYVGYRYHNLSGHF